MSKGTEAVFTPASGEDSISSAAGKRVFAMAPVHHHFEKKGWEEPKIIVRFWIISIVLALFAVMSLKVR